MLNLRIYTEMEQQAFKLHLVYSIIEGIILGVLALNEFVFLKSLKGTNLMLGMLFQASMLVFIFLVFINEFIKRSKNKKQLLRYTGIFTRGPLILLILIPTDPEQLTGSPVYHYFFLALFFIYYFGNTIIYPLINLLLKNEYEHHNFGKLYGWATSVNKIIMLLATFGYGLWLDADHQAYRVVFPFVAVLGIVSLYLLSLIPFRDKVPDTSEGFLSNIRESAATMIRILKNNKPYFHFETGFMFYGFSYMITVVVITIFFEKQLHLNYSSVAFYKNAYNILAIGLLPFTGKLLGKIDPRQFAIITFASLMFFVLFILLTEQLPYQVNFSGIALYPMLIAAYLFYGIFAATMALLWFIGSAYFCKPSEAGDYQSVHLFLTAVRALFAPIFGVLFYEMMGFMYTFLLAIGSLLISMGIMGWSYRSERHVGGQ